jgi:DMSO reductase family type II enzyme heme b subunit
MNSRLLKGCCKLLIAFAMVTVLGASFDVQAGKKGGGSGGGGVITAVYVAGADGLNPDDAAWNQAAVTNITLVRFIDYAEDGGGGGGMDGQCMMMGIRINLPVAVSAVHNGSTVFFRYEWADATADTVVNDTNLFGDALAMEIPYSGSAGGMGGASLAMGTQTEPVNIIFWRADLSKPQNIVAGGIGTPQPSPDAQNLQRYQNWLNGSWSVIVSRPLIGASDNQITLVSGVSYSVAFANWNGSDKNRNGRKAFSNWHSLTIE